MKTIKEFKNLRTIGYIGLSVSIAGLIMSAIFVIPTLFLNLVCGLYSNRCIDVAGPMTAMIVSVLGIVASCVVVVRANNQISQLENEARAEQKSNG